MHRRRFIAATAALAALDLAGCATPVPVAGDRVGAAAAPRVGERWRYRMLSRWGTQAPRELTVEVLEVGPQSIRDAMSAPDAGRNEMAFAGNVGAFRRPLGGGLAPVEFTPYLLAFGEPAPGTRWTGMAMPPDAWGGLLPWNTWATVAGPERIAVPAGTFDTIRIDVIGGRSAYQADDAADPVSWRQQIWFAPAARRFVRHWRGTWAALRNPLDYELYELLEHRPVA